MTFATLLERLQGVRRNGEQATARCPAHEDRRSSLSLRSNGTRILLRCHAGCSAEPIVAALGLTMADLFLEPAARVAPEPEQIVATYEYRDEANTLLYRVCRYEPKDFRPFHPHPDGRGGWKLGLPPEIRRVVYRLPELVEQTRAYVVEGEKDVETLRAAGLTATTTQFGANGYDKYADQYAGQVRDAGLQELILLPDHDAAGESYAAAWARAAVAVGLRVKLVRLPDLPPKGDVTDWLTTRTRADLERLVERVPWGLTEPGATALGAVHLSVVLDEWEAAVRAGTALSVVRTPFPALNHFLLGGFVAGELVYLGARPGVGKTALGLEIARAVAADGIGVLVVSREMVQLALARRILAQAARVSASSIKSGRIGDGEWVLIRSTLPKLRTLPLWLTDQTVSLEEITTLVAGFVETPPIGLLIIDYLQLVRAPAAVKDRRLQVEHVSQGLKTLALARRIPVLCLSSLSRVSAEAKDKRPTLDRLRESGELEHDADIVLFLHREFDQAETEVIVAKNRDGRTGSAKLLFRPEYVAFDEPSERPEPRD